MRLLLFLTVIIIGLCACNNDLTTIGQDLIFNNNDISKQEYQLTRTSTVKLDSFITSSGLYSDKITEFFMGKYEDNVSGSTVAYPCFQLAPSYTPSINRNMNLDSVTFNFKFAGKVWGDTLNPKLQTFRLRRLKNLPTFNTDKGWYFYNTAKIPWGTEEEDILSTISFLPKVKNMERTYFKLDKNSDLIQDLYEKMRFDKEIFLPSSSNPEPYHKFITYFKGLAIEADTNSNDCLLTILANSDSLYLRFHFHNADEQLNYDFKLMSSNPEYQYNAIYTKPSDYFSTLKTQEDEVSFSANDIAVVQGLTGYMVKIILPDLPAQPPYTTVIKAEIEIKPRVYSYTDIPMPKTISVYKTNWINEIQGVLYNSLTDNTGTQVTGTYITDEHNNANNRYIFDITDYFQRISTAPLLEPLQNQIMLTVPDLSTSYNRMIIKETPILRVYYAKYFE